MAQSNNKFVKFGLATAVVVVALVYLAWTGVQESKSYYMTIKELRADNTVYSKHLRVGGNVVPGSIHSSGPNADFVIVEVDPKTNERQELRVSYRGKEPPPDTFKDNAQALVLGEFGNDGVFHAHEIQAKCASKYAPQQPGAAAPADTKMN
ncbi:MAG TPA: cytochrome c maturation protein CcmE [Verrucomicrobiae bacterium]|jgi:cytochrome c-type biogenesis protein CcmE|nr:cytochrome c maturation protein CcmE [Verrucomicrobiae bacterium]